MTSPAAALSSLEALTILHVIDSGGLYGAETMLLSLALEHRRMGHCPVIASLGSIGCPAKAIETEAARNGLTVRAIRAFPGPNPLAARKLVRLARETSAHLVHCHGYKGDILLGFLPRKLRRSPVVATVHGYGEFRRSERMALYVHLDKLALQRLDGVVLVHPGVGARQGFAGIAQARWRVIPNGIPPIPDSTPAAVGSDLATFCSHRPVVGSVGRLEPVKGYDTLVTAFRTVVDSGVDARLVIVGEGGERARLEALSARLGIAERVFLPGYVKDAGHLIRLFDVFVLSSHSEGLPISLLEAMRAGTPIVASSVGGIPGVVAEGQNGLLFQPREAAGLAAAILRLLDGSGLARELAQRAKVDVSVQFSSRSMAENYVDFYRHVLSGWDDRTAYSSVRVISI